MKYAFFPGCVSRGWLSRTLSVREAGVSSIGDRPGGNDHGVVYGRGGVAGERFAFGDILNAHTLALAEQQGLPIMTICSTCQGVMSQANHRLATDPGYLDDINRVLAEEGLTYHGTTTVKHLCGFSWKTSGSKRSGSP